MDQRNQKVTFVYAECLLAAMEHQEFRVKGKEMVDFIADYLENIRDRKVYPPVEPGYLHKLLPDAAPQHGESWDTIFKDVEEVLMPGLVHWQSPHMHAYFPALTSYPSILGDMLSSGLNVLCFTWASSPAGTELETISMNWLGKLIGLPDCFLNEKDDSTGGGVIQTTASEATLVSLLAARTKALMELSKNNQEMESAELLGHLICYCSDQAHSSVEKAGLIGLVRIRYIESDEKQSMRGDKLEAAILRDKEKGLVPFWVCATLGSTGSVAFDNLKEVGEVCAANNIWLHVDAAYAGTAFICPEYRHWMEGIEMADSFAFNPSKWMMVNFDCTAMWVKDSTALHRTFNVNPIYLRHENSGKAIDYMFGIDKGDFSMTKLRTSTQNGMSASKNDRQFTVSKDKMDDLSKNRCFKGSGRKDEIKLENKDRKESLHWQIPLSKRFRALKLWFVLRSYGVAGLQKHVRESVRLANKFAALVLADPRFEIPQTVNLGLVAFRLKGDNELTEMLLKRLNARGSMHAVPACFKGIYVIRFTITSPKTTNQDILDDWNEIKTVASGVLVEMFGSQNGNTVQKKPRVPLKDIRRLSATFGTSLLLANSPMSPKIVNGTFAALCDYEQVLSSCAQTFAQLNMEPKDSPEMRRRIKGIKMSGKKFSLDSCMDMVQGMMVDTAQTLPYMKEDEHEDANDGSSFDYGSSMNIPMKFASQENILEGPETPRPRSRSIDVSLGQLILDSKVTLNKDNSEIILTPTNGPQTPFDTTMKEINEVTSEEIKSTKALDNELHKQIDEFKKLTIKAPESYIKKLINQFSQGSVECYRNHDVITKHGQTDSHNKVKKTF